MTRTTNKPSEALAAGAVRLSEDNSKLRETLRQVLATFVHPGHPGEPCLSSGWVPKARVELWQQTLAELSAPPVDVQLPAAAASNDEPACVLCGCTEERACEGGCAWFPNQLGRDLCTACVYALIDDDTALHAEEIWLVTDPDAAEPRAWVDQADAVNAALEAVRADWASSMGDAPAVFLLKPTGTDDGAPRWEVVVNAPASDVLNDPSGVTVHRLVVHGAQLRPEDVWSAGCTMFGLGQRGEHDLAPFTSPRMSEVEARRRIAQMRELFPEDEHVLLRWNIGPAVIVREDQAAEQRPAASPPDTGKLCCCDTGPGCAACMTGRCIQCPDNPERQSGDEDDDPYADLTLRDVDPDAVYATEADDFYEERAEAYRDAPDGGT